MPLVFSGTLLGGVLLYRYVQKKKPKPFPEDDMRNKLIKLWRLAFYIVLLPLGAILGLGTLNLDSFFSC